MKDCRYHFESSLVKLLLLFLSSLCLWTSYTHGGKIWSDVDSSVVAVEGESATLNWAVNLTDVHVNEKWNYVKIFQVIGNSDIEMVKFRKSGERLISNNIYQSRASDLTSHINQTGTVVIINFTLANLNRITDEKDYKALLGFPEDSTLCPKATRLIILVPPKITTLFCKGCENGSAMENQNITLFCNVTGKPMPNIRWMKNGKYYNGGSSVSSPNNPLVFQQVAIHDKGNYTCIADNGVGNPDRESFTLLVKYKPTNTILYPTKLDVCENTDITLNCTADAYPSVTNYSLYNGNTYIGSSSSGQFTTTAKSLRLNKFCCIASNEIGSGQCAFSEVYVLGNITTLCKINNENTSVAAVKEGDKVVLQCDVSGNESYYMYQWVKDSLSVRNDTRQLTFGSIKRTDEGYYQVTLRDKLNCSSQTRTFNITVNYKPENTVMKITPDKKDFCKEESINISCTSDAKPAPVYSLYRNNVFNGSNGDGVFVVKLAQNGNYTFTCVSSNTVGVGPNNSKSVTVRGPLIKTCKVGNESITNKTVDEGSEVVLLLESSEMKRLDFTWKNNTVNMSGEVGHSLTIQPITRYQGGQYQVVARDRFNCSADMECNFTLNVQYKPENTGIKIKPDKKDFCKGESINISCTSDAKPAPVYSLYRNNVFNGSNGDGAFVVKLAENGNYTFTCVSSNTVGVGPNKSKSVTVRGPLIKTCKIGNEIITNKTVVEGSEVALLLESSEMKRLVFTWKNNTVNMSGEVLHSLTLQPITRYQEGMYQVVARDRFNCSAGMDCNFTLNVQYKPEQARIWFSPNKSTVNEGEALNMTCKAEANPKPYYTWFFKGKMIQSKINDTISLSNIKASDAGEYTCTAINDLGKSTATKTMMVTYFRKPTCQVVPINVTQGANITLNCSASAYPPANYAWKSGYNIANTATVILPASPDLHDKSFTCTAANSRESKNCRTAHVNVLYKPRYVRITAQDLMVKEFGVVNLTCTTSSNPASNYTWSLNGRLIEGANRSLFVKYNVSRYDAGEYKCTASNEFGAAYNVTVVNVMYPPEFICNEKLVVVEGQERNFSCNAFAYPLPTYTVRYNFTNYPSKALVINLKRNDNGSIITCNASNSLGSAECKTVLIVTYFDKNICKHSKLEWVSGNESRNVTYAIKGLCNPTPNLTCTSDVTDVSFGSDQYNVIVKTTVTGNKINYSCVFSNEVGNCSMEFTIWKRTGAFKVKFKVKIVNIIFTSDLEYNTSSAFLNLSSTIKKMIMDLYKQSGKEYLFNVYVINFVKGSVWVNFELELIANVPNPLQPLQDALVQNKGNLSGLMFSESSLSKGFRAPSTSSTTTPTATPSTTTTESYTPTSPTFWEKYRGYIIGAIIGVLALIGLLLVIWWRYRKKRIEKNPVLVNNNNATGDIHAVEGAQARDNDAYSTSDYADRGPSHAEGGKDEPAYAAVDMTKRTKKKKREEKKNEMTYAALEDFQPPGGRGGIVLEPLPKGQHTKMPEKYEDTIYAEIVRTKKSASWYESASDASDNIPLSDMHGQGTETKPSDQTADPAKQNYQKRATDEKGKPPDNQGQPPTKEDSAKPLSPNHPADSLPDLNCRNNTTMTTVSL